MRKPIIERDPMPILGGTQRIYRFANQYGASVVRHGFSYGNADGLWELAVLRYNAGDDGDSGKIDYTTEITDDVIGNLTDDEVDEVLARIEALS